MLVEPRIKPPVVTKPPFATVSELPWPVLVPVVTAWPMLIVELCIFHHDPVPITVAEPLTQLMSPFKVDDNCPPLEMAR